jgi:prepilin-type N-terminal cleavage/methylation domain-containing protein
MKKKRMRPSKNDKSNDFAARKSLERFIPTSRKAGFTLVEILLAITILGIIMATVLGIFTGIISSARAAEKRAELYQTGRAVMDLLATDIRGLYAQSTGDKQVFFVGRRESAAGTGLPRLIFLTTNTLNIGTKQAPFLSEVDYFLEENPEKGMYSLWRRAQTPPQDPYHEGGRAVPVCRIIVNFELEFVHGDDIIKDLENALPRAIRIDFTLNLDGESERFVTMVRPMVSG